MSVRKKRKLWVIPATVSAAVAIAGVFMVYRGIQNKQTLEETFDYDMEPVNTDAVSWNGEQYKYNDHMSNFLFLGIDNEELVETQAGHADAGQSDAIFLLAWDRTEDTLTLISIPRDTMTSYHFYSRDGSDMGTVTDHLSLAYAYGDGKHGSCRNTADALSNLFYGLPIQGYCAVSLNALPILMEGMDDLTVTIPNSSLEGKYPEYKEGTELILNGENVEAFVRYRDITVSQSALMRQERQETFMKAYMEKANERFQEDPGFVTRLYTKLESYMVTNMGNDQFVKLMEAASAGGRLEKWTVPGEGIQGEKYDEYHVDDQALYEKIMETFYVEVE